MSGNLTHVLFENSSGYALFEVTLQEEIAGKTKAIQEAIQDFSKFSRMVKIKSFLPFTTAAEALENANDVSEGEFQIRNHSPCCDWTSMARTGPTNIKENGTTDHKALFCFSFFFFFLVSSPPPCAIVVAISLSPGIISTQLQSLLQLLLPQTSKSSSSSRVLLGVAERTLAQSISAIGIPCDTGERALELIRGIRLHAEQLLAKAGTGMTEGDVKMAQLGLGHSYSRGKVKFNVNRSDNMIIQAIALADQLDKDVNTFSMRIREWYSWHFPELVKLVPSSPGAYASLVLLIGDKSKLDFNEPAYGKMIEDIQDILGDDEPLARSILDAAKSSMGSDINEIDLINIKRFAERVKHLAEYRANLRKYLIDKMNTVAPNLSALLGETIGARLISHA